MSLCNSEYFRHERMEVPDFSLNACSVVRAKQIRCGCESRYSSFGIERVYLPLYKVADTPFPFQGDDIRVTEEEQYPR